jgi:TPR repeat protein
MCSVLAGQENFDLSQVQWAPTMEDVMDEPDIKMLVFFRDDHMRQGRGVDRFEEIGRLTDPAKIEKVMETIEEDANACEYEDECAQIYMGPTWMGMVNKNNQGFLINVGWNHVEERVEWWGRYSNRLYDILVEYEIIKPPKKPIFINDPNLIYFKPPQPNHLYKKPRVITTSRERDLEKFYVKVDPNATPVYVQVDPNSPAVYVAVDPNSAHIYLKELLPGINAMKDASGELMAQNKWLKETLDVCLNKLEAEKRSQPIISDPNDYVNRGKPAEPNDLPYERLQTEPLPETTDIMKLNALINRHCVATNMAIYSIRENIKRFERRMNLLKNYPVVNLTASRGADLVPEVNKKPPPITYPEELRQKVEAGDALAECDLGWCYFNGKGVAQDYNEASKWFHKAVARVAAHREQNNLGWCYYRGKGIEPNYAEPEKWFHQEAEKGNADAQYFLGWLYIYGGRDLKSDESEAVKWWRKSAEQGFAEAQYELGVAYFYGIGVEKNRDEGIKWQRKAAEQGLAVSQSAMELCLLSEPNYAEKVSWLLKAAKQGNTVAQKRLGFYASRGLIDVVEGYKWSLLAEKNGSKGSFALSLKEGSHVMGRKPMTTDQIAQAEELARNFKEVKSEVTARSVTTMYQAMTLWEENTKAHDFFFIPFW